MEPSPAGFFLSLGFQPSEMKPRSCGLPSGPPRKKVQLASVKSRSPMVAISPPK
jgi:hypothetical protein